jgi:hypothetical protein
MTNQMIHNLVHNPDEWSAQRIRDEIFSVPAIAHRMKTSTFITQPILSKFTNAILPTVHCMYTKVCISVYPYLPQPVNDFIWHIAADWLYRNNSSDRDIVAMWMSIQANQTMIAATTIHKDTIVGIIRRYLRDYKQFTKLALFETIISGDIDEFNDSIWEINKIDKLLMIGKLINRKYKQNNDLIRVRLLSVMLYGVLLGGVCVK